jgi:hypothetical protein
MPSEQSAEQEVSQPVVQQEAEQKPVKKKSKSAKEVSKVLLGDPEKLRGLLVVADEDCVQSLFAYEIPGRGCIVLSKHHGADGVAESMAFVPSVKIEQDSANSYKLVPA